MEVLNRVAIKRGLTKTIRVDHGTEFTSRAFDQWAYMNGVEIDFTRPEKPTEQRVHRVVQWQGSPGMPERELVPVAEGRTGEG